VIYVIFKYKYTLGLVNALRDELTLFRGDELFNHFSLV